jgi:hypothetical protein
MHLVPLAGRQHLVCRLFKVPALVPSRHQRRGSQLPSVPSSCRQAGVCVLSNGAARPPCLMHLVPTPHLLTALTSASSALKNLWSFASTCSTGQPCASFLHSRHTQIYHARPAIHVWLGCRACQQAQNGAKGEHGRDTHTTNRACTS